MDKNKAMYIGAVIKEVRKEAGFTQEQLAEYSKVGFTPLKLVIFHTRFVQSKTIFSTYFAVSNIWR